MVPVKGALAYFNLISSLSYVILVFSTLNTRAARLHMISIDHGEAQLHLMMPNKAVNLGIASKCTNEQ